MAASLAVTTLGRCGFCAVAEHQHLQQQRSHGFAECGRAGGSAEPPDRAARARCSMPTCLGRAMRQVCRMAITQAVILTVKCPAAAATTATVLRLLFAMPCCDSGGGCCGFGDLCGMGDGQFFVTADYLYVRASFSEATAFVRQDLANGTESSFRSNSTTSRRIASAADGARAAAATRSASCSPH